MKLRELAHFGVRRLQSRRLPPTKSHRQIQVYIHSLGDTRLLHGCDTGSLSPEGGWTKARNEHFDQTNNATPAIRHRWIRAARLPAADCNVGRPHRAPLRP